MQGRKHTRKRKSLLSCFNLLNNFVPYKWRRKWYRTTQLEPLITVTTNRWIKNWWQNWSNCNRIDYDLSDRWMRIQSVNNLLKSVFSFLAIIIIKQSIMNAWKTKTRLWTLEKQKLDNQKPYKKNAKYLSKGALCYARTLQTRREI